MHLLRDTIRALVSEAINRPGDPGKKKPERFEMNKFKALPKLSDMIEYADMRLDVLGLGTARTVFRLTGTRVLKLANNLTKGVGQNKAEVTVAANPVTAGIVTRIFEHDPKFRWVISEIVRPLNSEQEFQELTAIPWEEFSDHIQPNGARYSYWEPEGEEKAFIDSVRVLVKDLKLEWGDVAVFKHWGKSPDGRVVLLDYGYTESVRDRHYSNSTKDIPTGGETPEDVNWNEPPAQQVGVPRGHKMSKAMADLSKSLR